MHENVCAGEEVSGYGYPGTVPVPGYIPGYPASHGCIRMPEKMSKVFFENVSIGTQVIVAP